MSRTKQVVGVVAALGVVALTTWGVLGSRSFVRGDQKTNILALTWGQLKCQYNPDCVARQKQSTEENKNQG